MKYRKDFVTNSSSSSYVCDVCGHEECGMDLCLSDAGMFECANGHVFCEDHLLSLPAREIIAEILRLNEENKRNHWYTPVDTSELDQESPEDLLEIYCDADDDCRYSLPIKFCPICNFETVIDSDIAAWVLKTKKMTRDDIKDLWKSKFGSYEAFKRYIR